MANTNMLHLKILKIVKEEQLKIENFIQSYI